MGGDIALPRALVLALIVISVVGIFGIGLAVGSLIGDSVPPAPTATPTLAAQAPDSTATPFLGPATDTALPPSDITSGPAPRPSATPTPIVATAPETTPTPAPGLPARSRTAYGDCLVDTVYNLAVRHERNEFRVEENSTGVWDVVVRRLVDHVADVCRPVAPEPQDSVTPRCIPDALSALYRRNNWDYSPDELFRQVAAEYALTVCRETPTWDR